MTGSRYRRYRSSCTMYSVVNSISLSSFLSACLLPLLSLLLLLLLLRDALITNRYFLCIRRHVQDMFALCTLALSLASMFSPQAKASNSADVISLDTLNSSANLVMSLYHWSICLHAPWSDIFCYNLPRTKRPRFTKKTLLVSKYSNMVGRRQIMPLSKPSTSSSCCHRGT